MLLKGRIGLQEAIVDREVVCVENHLDEAESFVDRLHDRPVALFALLPGQVAFA
jgi:hypothetical protein